ncbi:hypothetical protein CsSME_00041981 [Camellia sinensis var. sinensis]
MNRLWVLHLNNVHLSAGHKYIFRRLLWLSWNGCPLECLPSNLSMEELVVLDLRYSRLLKQVWKGTKILNKLKFLYLSHCYYLTKTPDFSGLNSLEELLLNDCIRLVEVDESIGCLNKLIVLVMTNCRKLEQLPLSILMLKSLEYLDLSGCSKLRKLVAFKRSPFKSLYTTLSSWALQTKNTDSIGLPLQGSSCLKKLKMAYCNLSHLPIEIGSLISLTHLDLTGNNLCTLSDSICNLTCLQELKMVGCNLSNLPSEMGRLTSLTYLDIGGNNLCTLPDSIYNLTCLQRLEMAGCNVSHMPSEIGRLIALTHCNLKGNNLCTLPDSICNLTCLQKLSLSGCNVSHLPNEIERLSLLTDLDLKGNNLCTLPESIYNLTCLEYLCISSCNVSHLPSEIGRLISLKRLNLDGNNLCTLPESFCNLTRLGELDMTNCNVPSEIWRLQSLDTWRLGGNNLCSIPDGISNLNQLLYLYLSKSARLQSLPKLPLSLFHLYAEDCHLLENIELKGAVRTNMFLYGCHKLAGNNFANEFVKVYTEHKDFSESKVSSDIYLSRGEIPRWLQYQSPGSYLSFKVPLTNKKILGLFVCVVFTASEEKCNNLGPFRYYISNKTKVFIALYMCPISHGPISQDQMWLKFLPQNYLERQLEGGDEVEISIQINEWSQVKNCGAHLIYEVDQNITETNDEALTQYTSSPYQSVILEGEQEEEVDYPAKRRRIS